MPAPFTIAQLHTEINARIRAQVLPESITPDVLADMLDDIVDSEWNLADYPNLAANANSGMQGLPGEFVASVITEALQILPDLSSLTNAFTDFAIMQFPNDTFSGGFDNGNNWLLTKYVCPPGGFIGKLTITGVISKLLVPFASGKDMQFAIEILKNRLATPIVLATSNTEGYDDTNVAGDERYVEQFTAGTDLAPITLIGGDTVEVIVRAKYATGQPTIGTKVQFSAGLITGQKT